MQLLAGPLVQLVVGPRMLTVLRACELGQALVLQTYTGVTFASRLATANGIKDLYEWF